MVTNKSLTVKGVEVNLTSKDDEGYISLTDMTKSFNGADQLIKNWLQNKNTVDFLGVWEQLNNPGFNPGSPLSLRVKLPMRFGGIASKLHFEPDLHIDIGGGNRLQRLANRLSEGIDRHKRAAGEVLARCDVAG